MRAFSADTEYDTFEGSTTVVFSEKVKAAALSQRQRELEEFEALERFVDASRPTTVQKVVDYDNRDDAQWAVDDDYDLPIHSSLAVAPLSPPPPPRAMLHDPSSASTPSASTKPPVAISMSSPFGASSSRRAGPSPTAAARVSFTADGRKSTSTTPMSRHGQPQSVPKPTASPSAAVPVTHETAVDREELTRKAKELDEMITAYEYVVAPMQSLRSYEIADEI